MCDRSRRMLHGGAAYKFSFGRLGGERGYFSGTERKTRCIMGLDLQGQVGIATTQKPAPRELYMFDVHMCEQSEGWKNKFFDKFSDLFDRQGISKNHIVS